MSETEKVKGIINAIEQYEAESLRGSELQSDRAKAMDYYLGRPFGNEITGRSQVVSRDVADSIEWLKPGILKVFTSGDDVVSFNPRGEDDVEGAQQESDYVNYIVTQKNDWFNCFYIWATDALIQKNGYVKVYWDEKQWTEKESYEGKTDDELALVLQDPEVELVSLDAQEVTYAGPMGPMPVRLNNFTVQKKKTYGCAKYVPIPPERTLVSANHQMVDVSEAEFVEHWEYKTISDLRKDGFEVSDDIAGDTESPIRDEEEQARDRYQERMISLQDHADPSMKRVRVRECWLRYDDDGDGIAELRHVIIVGRTELLNEEVDVIPIACMTPRIMPHRHMGISEADVVMDIQLIKSTLQRGFLDNLYLSINGRHAVDKNKINLNDMLTSRPGGVVRTDGPPQNVLMPLAHNGDFGGVLNGIQYFDSVRESRTGSSPRSQQLSDDVLHKAPSGIALDKLQTASQAVQELIVRLFAETGVKRLFHLVHQFTLKHAKQPEVVRLRNKWVTVDPRQWKTRSDMTISVGLGSGDKQQQLAHLMPLIQVQTQLMQTGMTDLRTLHHTLTKLTNAMGFKDSASFWNSPEQIPPRPPQPNPEAQKIALQHEAKKQEIVMQHQLRMKELEAEVYAQQASDASQARQDELKAQFDMKKAALEAALERQLAVLQAGLDSRTSAIKAGIDGQMKAAIESFKQTSNVHSDSLKRVEGSIGNQISKGIADAMKQLSQNYDEVIVRDANGRAIGKKRVPAGTL